MAPAPEAEALPTLRAHPQRTLFVPVAPAERDESQPPSTYFGAHASGPAFSWPMRPHVMQPREYPETSRKP